MKETDTHVYFWGGYLSQWYPSKFSFRGFEYSCAEQFMMVEKARLFEDEIIATQIMMVDRPKEQKAFGRQIKAFDFDIWRENAKLIVYRGNMLKFSQNKSLKTKLLETRGKILVEASPYDQVWGVGLSEDDPLILDFENWKGTNWLGEILMKVREDVRSY